MTIRNATTNGRKMMTAAGMTLALLVAADATVMTAGSAAPWGSGHLNAQNAVEETLFLEARSLINQTNWQEAANKFRELRENFPGGYHVNDSFYWEAFARYRGLGQKEQAVLLLENMLENVPDTISADGVEFHRVNDARQLRLRILGELAEEGDPRAAQEVLRQSELAIGRAADVAAVRRSMEASLSAAERQSELAIGRLAAVASVRRSMEASLSAADSAMTAMLPSLDTLEEVTRSGLEVLTDTQGEVVLRAADVTYRSLGGLLEALSDGVLRRNRRQLPEHCEDASVQQEALTALMRLETDRIQILRSVIDRDDECSVNLRDYAVERLAREETEEAQRELIALAANHPDPETRRSAVQGLRRFDTQAAVDALVNVLTQADDSDIQEAAIAGLQRSENAGALTALEAYAADASRPEELREDAIVALGRRSDIEAGVLIRLYPALETEDLKSALIGRLRRIVENGDEEAESWLLDLTFNTGEAVDIRSEALDAWLRSQSLQLSSLAEAHGRLTESSLRERIFYALYRRADRADDEADKTEVVRMMVELARMESDPEVRERAVYWLGRTGSPEAVDFLLELLRAPPMDTLPKTR